MKKLIFVLMCLVLTISLFGCAMLKGDAGEKGDAGKTSYDIAVENGFTGTVEEWLNSLKGSDGIGIAGITVDHDGYVYVTLSNGEVYTIKVEDYCYHENTTKIVTSPTCIDRGYTTETCNDCGFVITNNYVEMIGHHFVDKKCNTCGADEKFGYITVNTEWYSTNNSTFTIDTREELAGLAYLVSEGNNFSGKTITLTNDIDLGGDEWIPIGNAKTQFAGTFDGREYTVSNLKISEQNEYVGLFGYVTGTVKRLNVVAASINVDGAGSYAGIACGYCTGRIEGISAAGFITAPDTTYVGGVCGVLKFAGNTEFSNFKSSAEVSGRDYVGGIFGNFCGCCNIDANCTVTISDFENSGNISGKIEVGGIFGRLCIDNVNSYNDNGVVATNLNNTGDVASSNHVGGLFGYAWADRGGSVSDSTSSASISGDYYVGGLAGQLVNISLINSSNEGSTVVANRYLTSNGAYYAYLGGYVGNGYEVINCVNASNIIYTSKGDYVGGIAGHLTYRIENCENNANITAEDSCNVGGLVGMLAFPSHGNNDISNCVNTGKITGMDLVGGLFGKFCGCCNHDANYTITFSDSSNSGDIVGEAYTGGLCGHICIDNVNSYNDNGIVVTDLSNVGNVTGTSHVGGLFGYAWADRGGSVTDATSSANIVGDYYVGGLAGELVSISLISCSNEGSTVAANDYQTVNGVYYAYLGGYVGRGYELIDCVNAIDITYTSKGDYIGGLAGYLTYRTDACENSGSVTAEDANYVGGLCGKIGFAGGNDIKNCKNSGKIIGHDNVGGLYGNLCGCFNLDATYVAYLALSENSGEVIGNDFVGGIAGILCFDNSNSYDNISLNATDLGNSGNITGNINVGGIFGQAHADNGGTLADYSNTGTVTGTENAGEIIGNNIDITIAEA